MADFFKEIFPFLGSDSTPKKLNELPIYTVGLDSPLITNLQTVNQALETLQNSEITPTTKREVLDRIFRAVAKQAMAGNLDYSLFQAVEDQSKSFYLKYYKEGIVLPLSLSSWVLQAISRFPIENKNRNLAGQFNEPIIREKIFGLAREFQDKPTTVISIAFGGSEPALLLSGLLSSPLVHVKPTGASFYADLSTLPQNPTSLINDRFCFIVDDATKSGATLEQAQRLIDQRYTPSDTKVVVIKPNPIVQPA